MKAKLPIKARVLAAPYVCAGKNCREEIGLTEGWRWADFSSEHGRITRRIRKAPKAVARDLNKSEVPIVFLTPYEMRLLNVFSDDIVTVRRSKHDMEFP